MANPVSNAEIEDVLSSIRRLVSEEPHNSRRRSEPEEAAADRLVLTPAQRVTITLDQKEAAAPAWAPDPDDRPDLSDLAQAPLADAVEQAAAQAQPDGQTLEERIAGLEAALRQDPDEWEPDGSEDHSGDNTRPISADAGFDMNTAWKGSAPQAKSEAPAEATPANTPSPIAAVPDPEAPDAADKPDASEEQADNAAAVSLADTEALFEALDEGGSIPTAPVVSEDDPEPARDPGVSAKGPETQAYDLPDLDSIDAAVSEGAALAASVAQGVDIDSSDAGGEGGEGAGPQPSGAVAGDEPVDPVASADPNVIVAAPRQPHPLPGYDLALDLTTIDAVLSEHPDGALSLSGLESESVFADEDSTSEAAETAGEADAEDAVTLFGGDLASTENAEDDAGAESGAEAAHDADAVDDARAQDDAGAHDGAPTTETEGQASPEDTAPEHATHEDVVHEDTAHEPLPQEHADLELETPEFETPEDTTPENTTPEDTASDAETSGSDTLERDTLDDAMSETAEAPKEQDDTEVAGSIADAEAEADAVPAAEMGSFEVEPSETGSDDEAASDEAEVETGDASQNDDKAPEAELSDAPLADEATLGDGAADHAPGVEEDADLAASDPGAETAETDTADTAEVGAPDVADLAEPSEADVAERAEEAASGDEIADEVSDEAPNGGARDTEETADATANVIALPEVDTVADALGARAAELSEAAPGIPMPIVPSEPEIAQKATAGETLTTPPPGEPRATDPAPFDDDSSFEAVSGIETIADVDLESVSDAVAAALEQEANQALDTELEGFDIADVDAEALVSMGLTPDPVDQVVDEDHAAEDNGEDYPAEESSESDEPPSVLILENTAAAEDDATTSEVETPQEAPPDTPASASKPDSAAALEAVIAAISEAPSQKPETAAEYDPDLEAAVLDDTDWDAEDTHAHSVAEEEPAAEDQTEHAGAAGGEVAAIAPDHAAPDAEGDASPDPSLFAAPNSISEDALRDLVSQMVRDELQGELGERITRNVRRLVRREIERALTLRDLD
ncbi:MAG: hypothetical protein AAF626_07865 [Pseudomonadota bacterium]